MDFGGQVAAFAKKANMSIDRTMRGVSIKLFSSVIKSSPVDSGRFRANWQASGKSPATGEVSGFVNPTATVITTVNGQRVADEFTLSNNLPYAAKLEYGGYGGYGPNTIGGFSKQAPQGMVRVNVARFQRLLDEAARENR
jgi:hypothetical protein